MIDPAQAGKMDRCLHLSFDASHGRAGLCSEQSVAPFPSVELFEHGALAEERPGASAARLQSLTVVMPMA